MAFGLGMKKWRKRTAIPQENNEQHPDTRQLEAHGHKFGLPGYIWSSITHHGRMFLVYCAGIALICVAVGSMFEGVDIKALWKATLVFLGLM